MELIQNILVTALLGIWACLSASASLFGWCRASAMTTSVKSVRRNRLPVTWNTTRSA